MKCALSTLSHCLVVWCWEGSVQQAKILCGASLRAMSFRLHMHVIEALYVPAVRTSSGHEPLDLK